MSSESMLYTVCSAGTHGEATHWGMQRAACNQRAGFADVRHITKVCQEAYLTSQKVLPHRLCMGVCNECPPRLCNRLLENSNCRHLLDVAGSLAVLGEQTPSPKGWRTTLLTYVKVGIRFACGKCHHAEMMSWVAHETPKTC